MPVLGPVEDPVATTGAYGAQIVRTAYTFANFTGTATIFTVTGDVFVRLPVVCSTSLTSAGGASISMGIAGNLASIIAVTVAANIIAREIWLDATPTTEIDDVGNVPNVFISDGNDIVLDTGGIQVDTGVLQFVAIWTPISVGASVVAT